jgi:hypothetical protein
MANPSPPSCSEEKTDQMALSITLRNEPLPKGTNVVVHMGAGDAGRVTRSAVDNYGHYRPIHPDGLGYFAVSVFAALGTVTIEAILAGMPHGQYATCGADRLLANFTVLPTIVGVPFMTPEVEALQAVHFDVVLNPPRLPDLGEVDPVDDDALAAACTDALLPEVDRLIGVFGPRQRNGSR